MDHNLNEAFKDRNETRILDLWMDLPLNPNASDNAYINQHFGQLDKDFKAMHKASKAAEVLTQSINMME